MKRELVVFITAVFICAASIGTCFGGCCPGDCCPPKPEALSPAAPTIVPAGNMSRESLEAPEIEQKQEIKVYEKQIIDVNESESKEKKSLPDKKAE